MVSLPRVPSQRKFLLPVDEEAACGNENRPTQNLRLRSPAKQSNDFFLLAACS